MQSKSVSVNRFITSSGIFAYRNGMLDRNTLDYNWYNESAVTEFLAFYTDDFPHDKFMTYVSYYGDTENYYFRQIGDDIPSELIIPESSISADFDYENNKFANISIDGSADQIAAYWTQEDSTKFVSLTVYSKTNVEEIQIPELPTEVLDQLNIDLTLFTLNNIGINEYDTADDFDDIINMVFQQQAPFVSLYNQNYSYRKYDDPEVLRNHKEYRTERDINFVE